MKVKREKTDPFFCWLFSGKGYIFCHIIEGEQNHRALDNYINNDYIDIIKSRKTTSNSKQRRQKIPITERRNSSLQVLQRKKVSKMQTHLNPYWAKQWPRDCNWTRTQNRLVLKRTLKHLAKLVWPSGWVFV